MNNTNSIQRLKPIALAVTYIFHPVFILFYIFLSLTFITPIDFIFSDKKQSIALYGMVAGMSIFFPLISIFAMRASGLLSTIKLSESKERIGPLITTIIFYLWLFLNYRQFDLGPEIFEANILGALISLFLAFFINNFSKISLHAVGIGGLLGAVILFRFAISTSIYKIPFGDYELQLSPNIFLLIIVVISGLVCTSRLFLRTHKPADVYGGCLVGFVSQLFAYRLIEIWSN